MKSRAGYWLGSAVMLLSAVAATAWLVVTLHGLHFTVNAWPRVSVPAESTLDLQARKYVVYYESPTAADGDPTRDVRVQVFDARTGAQVPVAPYLGSFTYDYPGHQGSATGTITPPRPGSYRVVTTTEGREGDADIAFGDAVGNFAKGILRAVVGSVVIGTVLFVPGLVLLIVTAVRRRRAGRIAAPTSTSGGIGRP